MNLFLTVLADRMKPLAHALDDNLMPSADYLRVSKSDCVALPWKLRADTASAAMLSNAFATVDAESVLVICAENLFNTPLMMQLRPTAKDFEKIYTEGFHTFAFLIVDHSTRNFVVSHYEDLAIVCGTHSFVRMLQPNSVELSQQWESALAAVESYPRVLQLLKRGQQLNRA